MKKTFLSLILLLAAWSMQAQSTLTKAKDEAKTQHKFILLNFSGSDWCIPCIQMEKEIFEKQAFNQYASDHLVVMKADFPRAKKHQLPKEQVKENEALAEQYNNKGAFPFTVLLDESGKVLKEWQGKPDGTAEQFVQEVAAVINTYHP